MLCSCILRYLMSPIVCKVPSQPLTSRPSLVHRSVCGASGFTGAEIVCEPGISWLKLAPGTVAKCTAIYVVSPLLKLAKLESLDVSCLPADQVFGL